MNKFITFLKDSYIEMTQHVTWSSFRELQNSSVLVLVASLLFALLIGLMDLGFRNLVNVLYNTF
jgi:preprotein translocase subunit SecE